jgi:hypothetical protein
VIAGGGGVGQCDRVANRQPLTNSRLETGIEGRVDVVDGARRQDIAKSPVEIVNFRCFDRLQAPRAKRRLDMEAQEFAISLKRLRADGAVNKREPAFDPG